MLPVPDYCTNEHKLTKAYADAMQSHGFKKFETVASIFFSLVTLEPLGRSQRDLGRVPGDERALLEEAFRCEVRARRGGVSL
jgi:hypothetical protein